MSTDPTPLDPRPVGTSDHSHPRSEPWLVVIDPQVVFADPSSEWLAPRVGAALDRVDRVAPSFGDRVIVTRWLPATDRDNSWGDYFDRFPFADQLASDPMFDLVPRAEALVRGRTLDVTTFGKYGPALVERTGPAPQLVLTGATTDCCVITTALAAADAGAWVTVLTDGCAGSTDENHAAALQVMGLYSPQIELTTTDAWLAGSA